MRNPRSLFRDCIAAAAGCATLVAAQLEAQAVPDSVYGTFASLVRASKPRPALDRLLTQAYGPVPAAQINALVDSVVALVTAPAASGLDRRVLLSLFLMMRHAGEGPTPFAGTAQALSRMAQSSDFGVSVVAMAALALLPSSPEVVGLLLVHAESKSPRALLAVNYLTWDNPYKAGGKEALKGLWEGSAVIDPDGCQILHMQATKNNWQRGPNTSCR